MSPRRPGHFHPRYAHSSRPDNENQQPTNNGNQLVPHAVRGRSSHNQSVRRYQNIGRYRNRNRMRQGRPQDGNNADHQMAAHNRPVPMTAGPVHDGVFNQEITRRPTSTPGMSTAHIEQQNSHSPPPLSVPQVGQMYQEMHQPHIQFPMVPSRTPTPRLDIPNNGFSIATVVPNQHIYPPMCWLPMTPDTPTAMLSHPNGPLQNAFVHPTRYMNHPNHGYFTPAPSPGLSTQQLMYHESEQPLSSCQQVQDSGHDLNSAAKEIQPSSSSVPTSVGDVTQRLSQLHLGDPVNASLHSNQVDSVSNLSYPPMIQESRVSRNISQGDDECCSLSTSDIPPSGLQTPVSLDQSLSRGNDSAVQQDNVRYNLMEYLENDRKVHEPRDVSHRFILQSYHVEETVGQQPQSLASQSGQSSVFPSGLEDEVAQKAERVPSVFNHTQGRPENSQNLDDPRDTTESLEYTTGRPSDWEHHTADPLIGLLPWSTGEETLLTSRNAQYEIHSSEKGDGNHIDSAGPADSSTSYVLPNSIALSNRSVGHWQHDMETLSPTRTDNGLLNKHEVIQKLLDILSTCDGAQRQCVFEALLAIDRAEAPQMPDMLMRYPGTLVILLDEIIFLTQQLARSKSAPHNAVHRGSGVLRLLQRMAAKSEVAQFLKNACIHSMILPIVTNRHADWATDVEDYVLEALKVYQILVDHIPPRIYTEKHLFGMPSLLEYLVNGDLAPKRGSDAEVHRAAEYIICKTLTTRESLQLCCEDEHLLSNVVTTLMNMLLRSRYDVDCRITTHDVVQCWVKITQDIRVEDKLLNDFPNVGASFSEVLNSMTSEEDEAARRALLAILGQLRSRKHTVQSSTDRVEVPGGTLGIPSSHYQAWNSQSQVTRGQFQHSRSQPGARARHFQGRHLGSNMNNPSTGDPRNRY